MIIIQIKIHKYQIQRGKLRFIQVKMAYMIIILIKINLYQIQMGKLRFFQVKMTYMIIQIKIHNYQNQKQDLQFIHNFNPLQNNKLILIIFLIIVKMIYLLKNKFNQQIIFRMIFQVKMKFNPLLQITINFQLKLKLIFKLLNKILFNLINQLVYMVKILFIILKMFQIN